MDTNEYRLGSKENPHPAFRTGKNITPVKKDRIKGDYYLVDGELYSCSTYNRLRNGEKIKKYDKKYREKNKEKINKRRKERRQTDNNYRILHSLRTRIGQALKRDNAFKNKRSLEYFNCTVEDFYHYIERLFTDEMNWDNQGKKADDKRGWELDHRRPCASFDFTDEEQIHMCFHYTNYQPLWARDNNSKSDKFDPETFPYEWKGKDIGWVGIYNFGK